MTYFIYPLLAGGAVVALVALVSAGLAFPLAAGPVLAGSALAVFVLERFRPHTRAWQKDLGDARTDRAHLVANLTVSLSATAAYASVWHATGGLGAGWPEALPFAIEFLLALAITDVGLYAVHRASHRVRWLWRLHAIHHSPARLYWINGQRRHLVHEMLEGLPGFVVLGALGAPPPLVACGFAAITIHLMYQHGNIEYRTGPLRHVFAVAEVHRWHHQRRWHDVQGNYGAVLAVWDHLFRSVLPQQGGAPVDVGMDDEPDLPSDWWGQMMWPFRRAGGGRAASSQ